MIKVAVFDWNGTLIADFSAIHASCNAMLGVYGHRALLASEYRDVYTIPFGRTLEKLGITEALIKEKGAEATSLFHDSYEPRAVKARTRMGARAMLVALKQKGVTCVVLSNHTAESISLNLKRLKLADYFDAVLANETIGMAINTGKQHRLEDYLAKKQIHPSQVLIVGDTIEEIHIGRNLGLKTAAITGGYHSVKRLRGESPDLIINSLHGIIEKMEDL